MMAAPTQLFDAQFEQLRNQARTWLVTGCAGFIGSNLIEALLALGQQVVGLDNFATGYQKNLDDVRDKVGAKNWARFRFIEGDIRDAATCHEAVKDAAYVLHHAALGSVPWSLADPITSDAVNVAGTLNLMVAARDAGVQAFVYATSSAVYGDAQTLPQREEHIGSALSPYAVTKHVNELYAGVFARAWGKGDTGLGCTGLRYFNIYGQRQDPNGAYAAVIPRWVHAMVKGQPVTINGDGETTRDFCHVANVVCANLLAALAQPAGESRIYNIAAGASVSLNQLYASLQNTLQQHGVIYDHPPIHADFRAGDVRHSQADISLAQTQLGYRPSHDLAQGLQAAMPWYLRLA